MQSKNPYLRHNMRWFRIRESLHFVVSLSQPILFSSVILSEIDPARSARPMQSKNPYSWHDLVRERKTYFVYILGSLSGTLYIGVTSRPETRVWQHKQHATGGFTGKYDVDRLLYWESFDDVRKAIDREKQLKGWRREKKITLIRSLNPHWLDLSRSWYEATVRDKGSDASTSSARSQATEPTVLSMTK
jgi:putative endonuclease